jgi:hypothetical protein
MFRDPFKDLKQDDLAEEEVSTKGAFDVLKEIKPRTVPRPQMPKEIVQVSKLARREGFVIDNLQEHRRKFRQRKVVGPVTAPITMRVYVKDWNRFQKFCEEEGLKIAEGFEALTAVLDQALEAEPTPQLSEG